MKISENTLDTCKNRTNLNLISSKNQRFTVGSNLAKKFAFHKYGIFSPLKSPLRMQASHL
jgi:hypothetical protein